MHSAITHHHLLAIGLLGFSCAHTACRLSDPLDISEQLPDTEMAVQKDMPEELDMQMFDLDASPDLEMPEELDTDPDLDATPDLEVADFADISNLPDMEEMPEDLGMRDMPDLIDMRYPVQVEAEAMTLMNYEVFNDNAASGGAWVQTRSSGTASMTFPGEPGVYRVIVTYYDEDDGNAKMSVSLNQVVLDEWDWDKQLGSSLANITTRTTHTIDAVTLDTGDLIEFQGVSDTEERARFDVVRIEPM